MDKSLKSLKTLKTLTLTSIHGKMKWFNNTRKKMEMIQVLRPTSKATLKMQCLIIAKADIDEANKLYEYFAKDMPDLPDYDPVPATWIDNTKQTANGIMSWLKENQNTLLQSYDFFRSIIANRGALPDLSAGDGSAAAQEPLPPINE